MSGDAQFAQSIRKLIPGTFSGSYKGAQPVVRALLDRGPVANETAVGDAVCICVEDTFAYGSLTTTEFHNDEQASADLCTTDMRVQGTIGSWDHAFSVSHAVHLYARSGGTSSTGYIFYIYTDNNSGTVTQGLGRNNVFDPIATELTGQPKPTAGDVLELTAVGTAITAKINGATIFSATDSAITDGTFAVWYVQDDFIDGVADVSISGLEVETFC